MLKTSHVRIKISFKFYFTTLFFLLPPNTRTAHWPKPNSSILPVSGGLKIQTHKTPSQPRPAFCKVGPLLIKSRISDYPTQPLSSVMSFLSATLIACFFKKLLILHSAPRHQMLPGLSDLSMIGKSTTRSVLQYF